MIEDGRPWRLPPTSMVVVSTLEGLPGSRHERRITKHFPMSEDPAEDSAVKSVIQGARRAVSSKAKADV